MGVHAEQEMLENQHRRVGLAGMERHIPAPGQGLAVKAVVIGFEVAVGKNHIQSAGSQLWAGCHSIIVCWKMKPCG